MGFYVKQSVGEILDPFQGIYYMGVCYLEKTSIFQRGPVRESYVGILCVTIPRPCCMRQVRGFLVSGSLGYSRKAVNYEAHLLFEAKKGSSESH